MSRDQKASAPVRSLRRQYALATGVFMILILAIIFLFGHLISRSLSRRYLDDALIAGREEARQLAEQIELEQFHVVEKRQELMSKTLQGLPQREVLESIEVTDRDGNVVFNLALRSNEDLPGEMVSTLDLGGTIPDQQLVETEDSYEISVPLGEVGQVVGRISKGKLAERVVELRRELMLQTTTVAVATLITLVIAFIIVWRLIQRTSRAEAKRHEAEEMAALGALAANLAHEIRNPLNSINLNLELLDEDLEGGDPDARSSLDSTRQEVGRLARLVSDFLNYARPSEPQLDRLQLSPLVEEVISFLKPEARRMGVHLRMVPDSDDLTVRGDLGQLRQVLLNLVLNATQAVAPLEAERRVVELAATTCNGDAILTIRDRGKGIPEESIEKVRQAFVTTRPGGTGLGLAIADRIVAAHGGRLDLCNIPGSGLEARIILPSCTDDGKIGA